ncbi:unnamed protein product (macronuclear) [Paramecium tetraurelia]|uniref:Major facilitator superfamily (MFS) profile domain-containing protein n=1 Tax=Paramecium tetraurelia TaxID=5888 RepID=A0E7E1_PARTE|nr:uncharacterized protein GSPATT00023936001 [Paramecium tetraurelia]CAK91208.1 unnamed protein product [Paramecium tetraurelia]|eukprot:XP_001458605.1 hypothetical protein (macronuclear) [Paramecium tetraurelia strain d4-2]
MFASSIAEVTKKRILMFVLCFFQYAFLHCCRSTWSYVSGRMVGEDYFTKEYLGYINFSFLFCYGLAISILGQFGDRMSLKVFILIGTYTSSFVFTLIGVMIYIEAKHNYVFLILQIINGIGQSTAWCGVLAILNNWFVTDKKVILMGYFAACPNIGNILGDVYSGILIGKDNLPLYAPIYLAGSSLFIMNLIDTFLLENAPPEETKRRMIEEYEKAKVSQQPQLMISMIEKKYEENLDQYLDYTRKSSQVQKKYSMSQMAVQEKNDLNNQLNYFNAWFVPNVALYALAFGCVKAVYYILGFWLPNYLDSKNVKDVAWITAMIDVGSIPGGILICLIGYYYNKRAVITVPSLWIGTIIMISVSYSGSFKHEIAGYMCLIFLTGLFIGGCYNNISTAMTVELSNQPELKNSKSATSTVVSVIMGYAAMFAAINQLIVPYVEKRLFLYCSALSIIGGVFLTPLIINEVKRNKQMSQPQ